MKLLIIEDEPALRESIKRYFSSEGVLCEVCPDYTSAVEKIAVYDYDCILLDIGLPDGDGLKILQQLKQSGKEDGVVIISARNSLDDRVAGLNLGADDYLVKPFHLAELMARVTAVYRRKTFKGNNNLQYQNITVNLQTMQVKVNDAPLVLTKKEYDMLLYFIANQGKVVAKTAIAEHLWSDEVDMADSYDFIYTHIKNLRKKLLDQSGKDFFKSFYGVGYRFS